MSNGAGGPAQAWIRCLGLTPHPEGGWYREVYRAADSVTPADGRGPRAALTTIDFVLAAGQCSAWHRVDSDEVWHLLDGGPLRLWLLPPALDQIQVVRLARPDSSRDPANESPRPLLRHVVPAHWWQAAEALGEHAYAGATVGPGFDFSDFAFGRDAADLRAALARLDPTLSRLL